MIRLHICCALACEARPLIDHWRLRPCGHAGIQPVYSHDGHGISLTVSGVGKANSAAAVAATADRFASRRDSLWLNVGIAGHADIAVGAARLATRIEDRATGRAWYPQQIFDVRLPGNGVLTLDKPCTNYGSAMFDMEASGFMAAAMRVTTAELAHVMKVVSDNRNEPVRGLSSRRVTALIAGRIPEIESIADALRGIPEAPRAAPCIAENIRKITAGRRFSFAEREQLRRLLERWQVMLPDQPPPAAAETCRDASRILNHLAAELDRQPLRLTGI